MRGIKANQTPGTFLTGGTGFFGCSILREHKRNTNSGSELTVLSRNPDRFTNRNPELVAEANWITGDILSFDFSLVQRQFEYILHAAADSTSAGRLTYLERYDQIVAGTRQILNFAVKCGARRFLLTSTGGVYGRQPQELNAIPEDYLGIPDPLITDNVYSLAKRAAEHICALYAEKYGLEIVIARCFSFVGEDLPLNVNFAIGNFIRDALWADEIIVEGDGTPIRTYLDQRDLAHWLITLLNEGKSGEAYNVGSDQTISIADLAHLVRELLSPGKRIRILSKPPDNAARNRYVPDTSKIQRQLGLKQTFTLEQSILNTAAAARKRGRP